jgi:hypothetical protein
MYPLTQWTAFKLGRPWPNDAFEVLDARENNDITPHWSLNFAGLASTG